MQILQKYLENLSMRVQTKGMGPNVYKEGVKRATSLTSALEYSARPSPHTVLKKKKVNGREGAKYFLPVGRGNFFWHHCIMVGVVQYILWLEVDMLSCSFFI